MSNSNLPKSKNSHPKPRKKNRPGWRRVVVGYRLVAMQASQVDDIAIAEAQASGAKNYRPMHGPRCSKCFLKNAKPGHFCRWNIEQEGTRNPNPQIRQVPIYEWVPPK